MSASESPVKPKAKKGFAVMDPAKVRELAKRGGKAAHEQGVAHEFSTEEAIRAGRIGGRAIQAKKRAAALQQEMSATDVVEE